MKPTLPEPEVITFDLQSPLHSYTASTVQRLIDEAYAAGLEDAEKTCDDIWQEDGTAMQCRDAIRSLKPKGEA